MQTHVLIITIVILAMLIGWVRVTESIHQTQEPRSAVRTQSDVVQYTAELCRAYFEYVDHTQQTITVMDKMCWR